jgi:lysophospholipase
MGNKRLKSAAGAAEEQLKAGARKLQEQLVTVEKAAGRLATKAKERLPAPADVKAEIPELRRRLQGATAAVTKRAAGGVRPVAETSEVEPPSSVSGSTEPKEPRPATSSATSSASSSATATPDDSWSVADLRAEARRRGRTGYSRKTKAELLADLQGEGASGG